MKLRATQAILECLLEQGVDTVFGYPGGTILNIYDELYRYQDKIRHILTAHEQGASHAADGYARATGKVGVCFATSGPGATNLTTGIATAHMDSSPVVFLTCNVGESTLGKDAFQEVDITGIAMPITKATYLVRDPNEIPDVIREAFAVAAMGRPGPVLIDLLKNVTSLDTMIDYEYLPKEEHQFHGRLAELRKRVGWDLNTPAPNREDVEKLVELIARSERPMLICGGGVVRSRADREFATLAQRLDAPVAITVMGGGGFPGGHSHHRNAGNARLPRLQHRVRQLRPAHRGGLPLLRPGGHRPQGFCQAGQNRPHRHRPGRDRQKRAYRPPHHRRCQTGAADGQRAHPPV